MGAQECVEVQLTTDEVEAVNWSIQERLDELERLKAGDEAPDLKAALTSAREKLGDAVAIHKQVQAIRERRK
jgi:predicted DNA-binding protein (UPF0251 family)